MRLLMNYNNLFSQHLVSKMCITFTLLLEEVIHKGLLGSFTNSVNCVGFSMLSN